MSYGSGNVNFLANDVYIELNGKHFYADDVSGTCDVDVEGTYSYSPAVLTLPNGDPGYPEESDVEVDNVEIDGDVEVEDYVLYQDKDYENEPKLSDDELEQIQEQYDEKIRDLIADNLTADDCSFDDDELENILIDSEDDTYDYS